VDVFVAQKSVFVVAARGGRELEGEDDWIFRI
jgi:hypothetical protein